MEARKRAKVCRLTLDGQWALDDAGRLWNVATRESRTVEPGGFTLIAPLDNNRWVALNRQGRLASVNVFGEIVWTPQPVGTGFQLMGLVQQAAAVVLIEGHHTGGRVLGINRSDGQTLWSGRLEYGEFLALSISPSTEQWLIASNMFSSMTEMIHGKVAHFKLSSGPSPLVLQTEAKYGAAALAWHPKDDKVVVGMFSGDLEWRAAEEQQILALQPGHSQSITHLCFTNDGKGLISVGQDLTLRFRSLAAASQPPYPLVYVQPIGRRMLDLVCVENSPRLVTVDEALDFRIYELPDDLWRQPPLAEEEMPPSHQRWLAAGNRIYLIKEGGTSAVLQDIGREIEATQLPPELAALGSALDEANEKRRAKQSAAAVSQYLAIAEETRQWAAAHQPLDILLDNVVKLLLDRALFWAAMEIMYNAGVDDRWVPWNSIPPANDKLHQAYRLLKECERIGSGPDAPVNSEVERWSVHVELAQLCHRLKKKEESLAYFAQSLDDDATARQKSLSHFLRGRMLLFCDDYAPAIEDFLASDSYGLDKPGLCFYNAACGYALSATAAQRNSELPPADRDALFQQHGAQAVAMLAQAQAAGFFKPAAKQDLARRDSDLDSLRSREDFKQWLNKVDQ